MNEWNQLTLPGTASINQSQSNSFGLEIEDLWI